MTTSETNEPATHGAGFALIACAVISVALLVAHPGGGGASALADVLRDEASHQLTNALVHGGFMLVLAVELVCFAALAVKAGARRTSVLAAMVFALAGAALLSASMIVDGLITPAVAARYVVAPVEKQEAAKALLVLIGATIRILMPMGLAFQGAAAMAWGVALGRAPGRAKTARVLALAMGAGVLAAAGANVRIGSPIFLMIALVCLAVWTATAGVVLLDGRRA